MPLCIFSSFIRIIQHSSDISRGTSLCVSSQSQPSGRSLVSGELCSSVEVNLVEISNVPRIRSRPEVYTDPLHSPREKSFNEHSRKKWKGEATSVTDTQKEQSIGHIKAGSGRAFGCTQVKVTLNALKAELRADPAFLDAVQTEEQAAADLILSVVSNDALSGSPSSAMNWSAHYLRVQALKLERQKVALKKKEVLSKVKAVDHITNDHAIARRQLNNLDNDEFNRYVAFQEMVWARKRLDDNQALEYGRIMEKVNQAEQSAATKSLNGLATVDNMFDYDDDDWDNE